MRVYRGPPDARLQPQANAANQAQTAWLAAYLRPDDLIVSRRPLRYPRGWPKASGSPQEKGVDVALAVDLLRLTYQGAYDVCIVCSHDTDLAPALDAADAVGTTGHHLEVDAKPGRAICRARPATIAVARRPYGPGKVN